MANLNVSKVDIDSIKESISLLFSDPEDIIKKYPECALKYDDVSDFLIGLVRSNLLWALYGDKMLSSDFRSDVFHSIANGEFK